MSDAKKPGASRDISDLKARLGLKKGGAAPATGQTRANGASGGVVAPPGMNLPPPPGVQPPQPAAPAIPNAADDPFGAMNAMAAVGTVQRAPEIVIVNDGKPVENVGAQSKGAVIAKIAVPAVVALGIGLAIGKVSAGANYYNDGIKGAKIVLGDSKAQSSVAYLKKAVADLDGLLDDMKTRTNYRPDPQASAQIADIIKRLEVRDELAFLTRHNADLGARVLTFFAGVEELKGMLETHNKYAKFDEAAFKKAKDAQDAAQLKDNENAYLAGQLRYAVVVQAPTESDKADFGAKLVEIAGVYCGGGKTLVPRCPEGESPSSFAYRNEPGGQPIEATMADDGSDSVPTKKMVKLLPNGVRDALVKGTEPGVSEYYYTRRVRAIAERTKKLIEDANKLEQSLQAESSKSKRFTFFL